MQSVMACIDAVRELGTSELVVKYASTCLKFGGWAAAKMGHHDGTRWAEALVLAFLLFLATR